jgi:hypothetical protein
VKPETLIRWHRKGFRLFWRWKSRVPGRPAVPADVQRLIATMAAANRTWGEERIANELLVKLGIRLSPRTVRRYMRSRPVDTENPVHLATIDVPGPTWLRFVSMISVLVSMILTVRRCLRSRAELQLELLALRHQLHVLNRSRPARLRLVTMDMALTRVARLANRTSDRQTGNRHRLASSGLPPVLAVEKSPTSWAANRAGGGARADSNDVGR